MDFTFYSLLMFFHVWASSSSLRLWCSPDDDDHDADLTFSLTIINFCLVFFLLIIITIIIIPSEQQKIMIITTSLPKNKWRAERK